MALICICAWIAVPMGDSMITLQTCGLFLALFLLPGGAALRVCCVYLLLGAVGAPVFSGFRGGIGMLLGPTGGFLWGFLGLSLVYIIIAKGAGIPSLPAAAAGLAVCYGIGSVWYGCVYLEGGESLWAVAARCVLPYVLPDAGKLALAWVMAKRLKKYNRG